MRNENNCTTRAYIEAQADYVAKLVQHCDYALTLQTSLRTYGISASTMERRLQSTRNSLHRFRMRLNRLLTGNGWKRNDKYVPVFVAAIEGTQNTYDKHRTLHIHIAIGNLPPSVTHEHLYAGVRQLWMNTEAGTADIKLDKLQRGTEQRWSEYIGKEANRGNWEVIDYSNTQAPKHILNTI
jgi:hypothetical protein